MDIKQQIEALNEVFRYTKYMGKVVNIDGDELVVQYSIGNGHYVLNSNIILFDKDFLKAVFGTKLLKRNLISEPYFIVVGKELFLSDNRLETFFNLYLEYNKKGLKDTIIDAYDFDENLK